MARIHGNRGQVSMDPTGGATVAPVADLNEWTLDMSRERVDVTCFGDTNKQSVNGLPAFTGTYAGFWNNDSSPELFRAVLGDIAVMLHLIMDANAPTYLFKGLANLDGTVNVSATGAVTVEGKFEAAGLWTMEPAAA